MVSYVNISEDKFCIDLEDGGNTVSNTIPIALSRAIKKGKVKIELAVGKGKKQFDKRATKKNRDWNRDKARYIRKSS